MTRRPTPEASMGDKTNDQNTHNDQRSMSGLVLVTGAAGGQQGKTGRHVAEGLLKRGVAVRAFVRTDDERPAALRELGAEVVVGDLREIRDVEPALDGVDRVFFTYPVADGLLAATAVMAAAAKEAGIRRLVDVSFPITKTTSISPRARQHWVSERIFEAANIGAVHVRAAAFFENVAGIGKLARNGEFAAAFGPPDGVMALVAGSDVARVATGVLADAAFPAQPYYRLISTVLTVGELVDEIGIQLGTPLRYVEVEEVQWREKAIAEGVDPEHAGHLSRWGRALADMAKHGDIYHKVTTDIEKVIGAPPLALRDFLQAVAKSAAD